MTPVYTRVSSDVSRKDSVYLRLKVYMAKVNTKLSIAWWGCQALFQGCLLKPITKHTLPGLVEKRLIIRHVVDFRGTPWGPSVPDV